ncbi:MAG: hydroxyacid dehydrogenase [Actinobacteria bacterium]|nr:hydroxyacid dehydrogenase [Actinomycetota bacterium]
MGKIKKVLITQPIHEEGIKLLEKEVKVIMASGFDEKTLIKESADCDGILVRTAIISGKVIENALKLKVIGRHGVGVDNIDLEMATRKGVAVVNAPDSNIDSVAEHVLGMILALAKNFVKMDKEIRRGRYELRNKIIGMEIKDKIVGIIGLGNIGMAVAKKLKALEVKIIAYDPCVKPSSIMDNKMDLVSNLNKIYSDSDIVTVHVPLTENTIGMIGKEEFKKMKKSAFFINTSRGQIIDEIALCDALMKGEIRGAALDVFIKEPPSINNPLFKLENIILSPHNAALTEEAMIKMATHSAQGILDYLNGKIPKYFVNPEVLG